MEERRTLLIGMIIFVPSAMLLVLHLLSHSTYYKYNDMWIIGHSVTDVKNRYGEFDLYNGAYAAYYIYTDNRGFLPDHLDHYYYMYYDENEIVTKVGDSCQPGG